ncbi:MAG: helix-turn-helix domain-containing protein [Nanoarchaeota archaeon]
MHIADLEKLGLNKNEAKVYFGLLKKGQATASELVKSVGVHRNIIYDNLEKLIDKGLVSYVVEGTKRKFIAEKPESIIDFLETKKKNLEEEIKSATNLIPEINSILSTSKTEQETFLFRGIQGVKKILQDMLSSKEFWIIGVSNASVEILGETYWTHFNQLRKNRKIKEHLLFNADFKNTVGITKALSERKKLPRQLIQVTEIMLFEDQVAIIVYSGEPLGVVIKNEEVFNTFRKQFDFLWNLSKEV